MAETAINEKWILARAREGDTEAFSALVRIYEVRAVHTAYAILGNFEDARDAAQEAFIKAHGALSHFREDSQFFTWFYRILSNACKDFLRKKKMQGFLSFGSTKENEEGETLTIDAPSSEKSALEEVQGRELQKAVTDAMNRLPFQQRTTFGLRYLEGLSLEEIATQMDLSVGAVKAHLWQAGQKMKKFLKNIHEF